MPYVLSHDVFASKGDPWDHRARREAKPADLIVREVRRVDGVVEVSHRFRREGFGPDGPCPLEPVKRFTVPTPKGVNVHDEARRECAKRMPKAAPWRPSQEHYHRREELLGKPTPLTPEQLALKKKQQAQMKARRTRAANRIERERQEVLQILGLI